MYLGYKTRVKENVIYPYCNISSSFAISVVVYVRLQLSSFLYFATRNKGCIRL